MSALDDDVYLYVTETFLSPDEVNNDDVRQLMHQCHDAAIGLRGITFRDFVDSEEQKFFGGHCMNEAMFAATLTAFAGDEATERALRRLAPAMLLSVRRASYRLMAAENTLRLRTPKRVASDTQHDESTRKHA